MPNGDPDWGETVFPKLEAFFAPIADEVVAFAQSHNLRVNKYYHESSGWSLRFSHPKGGTASIELHMVDASTIMLCSIWYVDDYEAGTRSSKLSDRVTSEVSKLAASATLRELLSTTLSWELDSWDEVVDGLKKNWHAACTREQFDAMGRSEPTVRFDGLDDPHVDPSP